MRDRYVWRHEDDKIKLYLYRDFREHFSEKVQSERSSANGKVFGTQELVVPCKWRQKKHTHLNKAYCLMNKNAWKITPLSAAFKKAI